jgi:hypothetical protein
MNDLLTPLDVDLPIWGVYRLATFELKYEHLTFDEAFSKAIEENTTPEKSVIVWRMSSYAKAKERMSTHG